MDPMIVSKYVKERNYKLDPRLASSSGLVWSGLAWSDQVW